MRYMLSAALLVLSAGPVFADAVTYSGTLGGHDILVELTDPSEGAVAGRYTYLSQGADIPLQPRSAESDVWVLVEEAPCGAEDCVLQGGSAVVNPPIAATWSLTASDNGKTLAGTWTAKGAKSGLPIQLHAIGARTLDQEATPYALHGEAAMLGYDDALPLTVRTAPYDMMRLEVAPDASPVLTLSGGTYNYLTDPRTKFAFPSIVSLSDGSSPMAVNAALQTRRFRKSIDALDCKSFVYGGFGATDSDSAGGTLGGYEDEQVKLTYLSPQLVSWTEQGSLYCGGAHPNNHAESYSLDVVTGLPLDLSRVLSGWVPREYGADIDDIASPEIARANPDDYHWGPDQALIDWVRAHRQPDTDPTMAEECGIDDLIPDNLAIRFEGDDKVVFTLEGLPNVIFACTEDLVTVSLADIPELLAPGVRDLFPHLKIK